MPLITKTSAWLWAEKTATELNENLALVLAEIVDAIARGELRAEVPQGVEGLLPGIAEALRMHATVFGEPLVRDDNGIWNFTHRFMVQASDFENWFRNRVPSRRVCESRQSQRRLATEKPSRANTNCRENSTGCKRVNRRRAHTWQNNHMVPISGERVYQAQRRSRATRVCLDTIQTARSSPAPCRKYRELDSRDFRPFAILFRQVISGSASLQSIARGQKRCLISCFRTAMLPS